MTIGTNELKGFTADQLRTMYAEARGICVGAGRFPGAAEFDAFLRHYVDFEARGKDGVARSWVQSAFGQVSLVFAKNVSIPPSQETLDWGGFLGGEVHWDHSKGDAIVRQIMANAVRPIGEAR